MRATEAQWPIEDALLISRHLLRSVVPLRRRSRVRRVRSFKAVRKVPCKLQPSNLKKSQSCLDVKLMKPKNGGLLLWGEALPGFSWHGNISARYCSLFEQRLFPISAEAEQRLVRRLGGSRSVIFRWRVITR